MKLLPLIILLAGCGNPPDRIYLSQKRAREYKEKIDEARPSVTITVMPFPVDEEKPLRIELLKLQIEAAKKTGASIDGSCYVEVDGIKKPCNVSRTENGGISIKAEDAGGQP